MSTSDSSYFQILNNSRIYLNQYIVPIFYIFGNIGNLLSALIFARKSWRKNVCVFYFNICLFFNLCYINSSMLKTIISNLNIDLSNLNNILCKLYFYTKFLFSTLLPTILILASIDRLLISSQNVDTRLYSSKRLAYFSVSICTLFWFIFYFHILIKVDIQEIHPSHFECYYDLSKFYRHFIAYSSLITSFVICLFMIVLCILAFKNVRHIRIVPRQQRKEIRSMTKRDFQLLRCLFVQDIVYIISSIGLSLFTAYAAPTINTIRTPSQQVIYDFFDNVTECVHHIPYCASFYIFVFVSKAFRMELKRIAYKICGKEVAPLRVEENGHESVGKENIQLNVVIVNDY